MVNTNQSQTLQTERLTLRPLVLEDADKLFPIFSDPQMMRFMPMPPHESVTETRHHLTVQLRRQGAVAWAICWRDSGELIGQIDYLGETSLPGMGYLIKRELWGQGLAPEACQAALAYGFNQLGFDRVELWINEENVASQRVAQKLNFRLRGQLAQKYAHRSQHHLMLVFGLRAHEWRGETATTEPTRFLHIWPVLMVHNLAETVAFYRDKLGFKVDFTYGDPPEHAGVSRGDWSGGLVSLQLAQVPAEREIRPAGYLYIIVDTTLDHLYETYRANGVEIVAEPESYPWGMREFGIRDLNGHIFRFGTHL
ncbi:MAG TPA: GNAT family N-acetyltransferase [Anaerolineae bacterium]|nr:GNAT family N-acetyltransferase [Anaerolineae bacterium]